MGRTCKLAFSYGLESNPAVTAKFLAKLNLGTKHAHIQAYVPKIKPPQELHTPEDGHRRFLGNAQEIGGASRWLDVGASKRRGTYTLDNNTPPEIRRALL